MKSKLTLILSRPLIVALGLLISGSVIAQDAVSDPRIQISIEKDDNGNVFELDTSFIMNDEMDVQELLRSIGVDGEFNFGGENEDVEIIINKRKSGDKDSESLRIELNEYMKDLDEQIHVFRGPETDPNKAFLGVYYDTQEEGQSWTARVSSVIEGTGAEAAGLQKEDMITSINGEVFGAENNIHDVLAKYKSGDVVTVEFIRAGQTQSVQATLGTPKANKEFHWNGDNDFEFHWDESDMEGLKFFKDCESKVEEKPFLGVYLGFENEEGLRISGTAEGSTAEQMGLQENDLITAVNGVPVNDYEMLVEHIMATKVGGMISVDYTRDGKRASATGTLGSKSHSFKHEGLEVKEGMERCFGDVEDMIHKHMKEFEGESMSKELMEDLKKLRGLEDLNIFFSEDEFDGDESKVIRRVAIFITMDNISESEAAQINENSDNKISLSNDLPVDGVFFSPNPSEGRFNINFELVEQGDAMLRIYDSNGRQVYETFVGSGSGSYNQSVDISEEPKGVYFMQITQNGKNFAKKVVIQ